MNEPQKQQRKTYVAPSLTEYGDVKEITAGNSTGTHADDTIQTGEKATFLS